MEADKLQEGSPSSWTSEITVALQEPGEDYVEETTLAIFFILTSGNPQWALSTKATK